MTELTDSIRLSIPYKKELYKKMKKEGHDVEIIDVYGEKHIAFKPIKMRIEFGKKKSNLLPLSISSLFPF